MADPADVIARLSAAVHAHEQQLLQQIPDAGDVTENQPLRWMVLTQDLASADTATLTGSIKITVPTVATAQMVIWQGSANGGKGGYVVDPTNRYYVQEATGKSAFKSGQWLLCRPVGTAGGTVWEPVATQSPLSPFELYDDMTPGGTDKYAWPLNADLTRDTTDDKIQVSDQILGDVRAYGSNHSGFTTGAKGFYTLGSNGNKQIINIQRVAKWIQITAPANKAASASFTVTSCTVLDDGQNPCGQSGATISITNWSLQLCNSATAICVILGGTTDGSGYLKYLVIDAPCPPGGGCS